MLKKKILHFARATSMIHRLTRPSLSADKRRPPRGTFRGRSNTTARTHYLATNQNILNPGCKFLLTGYLVIMFDQFSDDKEVPCLAYSGGKSTREVISGCTLSEGLLTIRRS